MIDYIRVCDICEEPFDLNDKTVKEYCLKVELCFKDMPNKILGKTRVLDIGDMDICDKCRKDLEERITFKFAVERKSHQIRSNLSNGKIKHINQEKSF